MNQANHMSERCFRILRTELAELYVNDLVAGGEGWASTESLHDALDNLPIECPKCGSKNFWKAGQLRGKRVSEHAYFCCMECKRHFRGVSPFWRLFQHKYWHDEKRQRKLIFQALRILQRQQRVERKIGNQRQGPVCYWQPLELTRVDVRGLVGRYNVLLHNGTETRTVTAPTILEAIRGTGS